MRRVEQYVGRVDRYIDCIQLLTRVWRWVQQKLEEAHWSGVRVVVDLAFAVDQTSRVGLLRLAEVEADVLVANEVACCALKERHSVFKQLGCVYGYLKTCPLDRLLSLHLASCTQDLAAILAQHGVPSWKVSGHCAPSEVTSLSELTGACVLHEQIGKHEEPLEQLYPAGKLVYLSPDSSNVLETLDPNCVYVVGGIADRSVRKVRDLNSLLHCCHLLN
jgi:hypothetical protein